MVIAVLYGCSLGAIAALPADYLWRRRACTLLPPRVHLEIEKMKAQKTGETKSGIIRRLVLESL